MAAKLGASPPAGPAACLLAELVGTFLLVLIGDGAIASYVLTGNKVDLLAPCLAFGVGAMLAGYVSGRVSGAHLNPAASVALALDGQLSWRLVPGYLVGQYLGGFLAALLLYVNNREAIWALDGGAHSAQGSANSTGHIFATYPAAWLADNLASLRDQTIGTAVLLFGLSALADPNNSGLAPRHQPPVVALVVGFVCLAFAPNCGAIFNPARDLGPRLASWLLGYSGAWAPLDGGYWLSAALLGPHLGAVLGVFGYRLLIGRQLAPPDWGARAAHWPASLEAEPPSDSKPERRLELAGAGAAACPGHYQPTER